MNEATIAVKLSDGTALLVEVVDGQTYCIAAEGKEFQVEVTIPADFLRKHEMLDKHLRLECFIDGASLGYSKSDTVSSENYYNTDWVAKFSDKWNADGSLTSLMFMKLEQVDWHDVEDSKTNALKLQASKVGLIEVFIESETLQEDDYTNKRLKYERYNVREKLAKTPVVRVAPPTSASASVPVSALALAAVATLPVSSFSAPTEVLVAIPVAEVPKAGDTAVKNTKEALHRRTLTLAEGKQTKPAPPPQPDPSLPKTKIWVFSEELAVLRIAYQTEKWLLEAKADIRFRLMEAANKRDATFAEALDGEVVILPKRQRELVVIDLTVEEVSQDSGASGVNLVEQIRKLAKLHEEKLLTDDEFSQAKAKVLR